VDRLGHEGAVTDDRIPNIRQAVVRPDAKADTTWFTWFSFIDRSVRSLLAASGTTTAVASGGAYTGVAPIIVNSANEVRLAQLTDTGTGTGLWKFTRNAFGLVSGTEAATTDDLAEGASLYYTDERAQDAIAAALAAGTHSGISFTYNDAGNAISATITASGTRTITSVATNTTAGAGGDFVYFVSAGATLSLPAAAANTGLYTVKCVDATLSSVVDTAGTETIDGLASQTLNPGDSMTFCSDGTNWEIV